MTEREKVIKGLEEAVDWLSTETSMTVIDQWVVRDALVLLKAQEPRVMTLDELETLQEDDVIWVEIKPVGDLTCISIEMIRFVEKVQDPSTWFELHTTDSAGFYMTRKTTEPNWRCWTSRPDEQRRAETPWN